MALGHTTVNAAMALCPLSFRSAVPFLTVDKRKGRRLTLDFSDTGGLCVVDYSLERGFNGEKDFDVQARELPPVRLATTLVTDGSPNTQGRVVQP